MVEYREQELIDRCRSGDRSAFADLIAPHAEVAFRMAVVISGSAEDAEDACQEAFVRAHRYLGRFRRGHPFRPWLLAIVANQARNARRSTKRRQATLERVLLLERPAVGDAGTDALSAVARQELIGALGRLDERDRTVIACRYLLDLPERETAAVLDVAPGTVKSRLSRALERLRGELEEVTT